MADPLPRLREYVLRGEGYGYKETEKGFQFGTQFFPRNRETSFRSQKGKGKPYTLASVAFLLKNEKTLHHQFA